MSNQEGTNEDQQQKTVESKELQKLKDFNQPGIGEEKIENHGARQRQLSIAAAKANYDIAMDNFSEEMDQLEDPGTRITDEPQLRAAYKEIKYSEQKMLKAAEDYKKAIERSGSTTEIVEVDNEVVTMQTRLGTFKHGCKIGLHSEAGSVTSQKKTESRASTRYSSSSSSSKAKLDRKSVV